MSDFLTRMASLTRGETTAVKPRLPGRFAPASNSSPADPFEDVSLAHGAYKDGLEPDHSQRPPAPEPEPVAAGKRAIGKEGEPGKPRPIVDTDAAADPSRMIHVEVGDDFIPSQPPLSVPLSTEPAAEPASRKILAGMDRAVPDFDYTADMEIPNGSLQPGNEGDPMSLHESDATARTPSSPAHPKLLVRTQPANREETGLPDLPDLPDTPQRNQSEPVVHINIGRIEVRASTSAPRPQPGPAPARQQSSMSLQDYLARGQTGGKRS